MIYALSMENVSVWGQERYQTLLKNYSRLVDWRSLQLNEQHGGQHLYVAHGLLKRKSKENVLTVDLAAIVLPIEFET